jgi:coenzyme F420-reducing hydrogenase gamma subunit
MKFVSYKTVLNNKVRTEKDIMGTGTCEAVCPNVCWCGCVGCSWRQNPSRKSRTGRASPIPADEPSPYAV